jgi:hypothetical protein
MRLWTCFLSFPKHQPTIQPECHGLAPNTPPRSSHFCNPIQSVTTSSQTPLSPMPLTHSFFIQKYIPPILYNHKLKLSKLKQSPLLCRLTTPSLKNLSSPPAVRPPIYHFSAPNTSRNPSDEESELLRVLLRVLRYPPAFVVPSVEELGLCGWVPG